jgi:hypothetical protein
MHNESRLIFESYKNNVLPKTVNESHECSCGCEKCGLSCPCDADCECKNKKQYINSEDLSAQLDPKTGEAEDWRQQSYRVIEAHAQKFLDAVYSLGYSGEAGERDTEYLVEKLNEMIDTSPKETADAWRVLVDWQIKTGSADM